VAARLRRSRVLTAAIECASGQFGPDLRNIVIVEARHPGCHLIVRGLGRGDRRQCHRTEVVVYRAVIAIRRSRSGETVEHLENAAL